ncbi:MAG: hypothetical protein Tsb0033_26960 [Winogradskyella sp.]
MFRVIKQNLLKNQDLRAYLKYAFGEIILVMLGILLAIQINNWREEHKNVQREKLILKDLNKDFSQNLEKFKSVKKFQYRTFNSGAVVFRNIQKIHIPVNRDSVYKYLPGMFGGYTYYPSNGVVESLISTGDIKYIRNDSLKKLLVSWKDVLKDYSDRVAIEIRFWSNNVEPYVIKNGDFLQISSDKNKQLAEDPVFINMLVRQQHYNRNVINTIEEKDGIEHYMKEIVRLSKFNN